jgi:hypothetical protein
VAVVHLALADEIVFLTCLPSKRYLIELELERSVVVTISSRIASAYGVEVSSKHQRIVTELSSTNGLKRGLR